jgi:hypothetical protein
MASRVYKTQVPTMVQPVQTSGCLGKWFQVFVAPVLFVVVLAGLALGIYLFANRPSAEVIIETAPVVDVVEQVETVVDPDGVAVHFHADSHCTRYAEWVEDVPDLSTDGRVNQVRKAVCVGELLEVGE